MSTAQAKVRTDLDSGAAAMARGAGVNLVGSLVTATLAFAFTFVITHVISADDVGLFSLATTVVALAFIPALMGLDTGVIRFVALGVAHDSERRSRGALQTAFVLAAGLSVVVATAIFVFAPWIAGDVFGKPEATDLLRIVSLSLPGLATGRIVISTLRGFGVMAYSAWLGILSRVFDIVTALPLLALGFGVVGLAWASVVAAYASLAVGIALVLRVHSHALRPARGAWPVGRLLRFSLPQTLTSVFFFGITRLDVLLLAGLATATEVGIYTIAARALMPATLVSTSIGQMFAPRITLQDERGDRRMLATMLKRVTYWNTAVSLPFFAALIVVPVPILALFGSTYTEGAQALVILAIGQLLNTAAGPLGQLLNMSGRPYITMLNNAFVALLNLGLGFLLIPSYGMTGAAIATGVALVVANLIKLVQVRVIFAMYPFRRDSVGMLGAAVVAATATVPVAFLPSWPSPVTQVAASLTVLFVAYTLAMRSFGLTTEDRELATLVRTRLTSRLRPR